jgi:hypothetical protein
VLQGVAVAVPTLVGQPLTHLHGDRDSGECMILSLPPVTYGVLEAKVLAAGTNGTGLAWVPRGGLVGWRRETR